MTHGEGVKVAIEMRNSQIEDLISKLEESEAEVERLKGEAEGYGEVIAGLAELIKSHEAHTWQQERVAVVAWLRDTIYDPTRDRLSERIESGEHWPEGGAP